MNKKAVILFSGGLDSTTCLFYAKSQGFDCYALSFNYHQRHSSELLAAQKIAEKYHIPHKIFELNIDQFKHSALTDLEIAVPKACPSIQKQVPITYVPARNTIFLSIALGYAETLQANDIFIGVSHVDYSGYPDCRPAFIQAFQHLANLATKAAIDGQKLTLHTPLINLSKAKTIELGLSLGIDFSLTVSCYQADHEGKGCGICESCSFRKKGFADANIDDPTYYQS